MIPRAVTTARQVVALFNSNDDTVAIVRRMLGASGYECLVGCHLADLRKGIVDFGRYMDRHRPDVVIFDILSRDDSRGIGLVSVVDTHLEPVLMLPP